MNVSVQIAPPQFFYAIGDVHGQLKKLTKLLRHAGLVDEHLSWRAGSTTLWFIGDLVDRGPDGIAVLNLVMRLQNEATAVGGCVGSLLGNHEMMMLAAYRFGRRSTGLGSNFLSKWKQNGGNRKDLAGLHQQHLDWMAQLPAMALVGDYLLMHADAPFYIKCGHTIDGVNATFRTLMKHSDALAWEEMLDDFARRGAFLHTLHGEDFARRFLNIFGGCQLMHGHTPISAIRNCSPKKVDAPWIYAGGQCVNIDGGMFLGGSGFVHQFPLSIPV
ncbi:MAG: serine/threonine protein phosphatase [Chloroflexi bacterium]|nr:MAG: serine/threonine protein phosphatase [Chloroflexota bacterium]